MIPELDGATWHKSTYSGNSGGCVERGILPTGRQAVRDTKDRERGALLFGPSAWQAFVNAVRDGEFGG
ncbi:DUF397 domain-containing protein [Streptomyces iranensis]|uniref:Regulatory protein n=1 Tax=Streptomyces iranensis TaxID=576784 RepID=A0A060ZUZ2_9ACTN|nr:DUF397 domain-containing protein [Streptomyces iranensis]MBP2065019.1 hypothetical protein [Streptomyces iranensis]CDR10032.1 regulatory protein [Streptomyces iranensis]